MLVLFVISYLSPALSQCFNESNDVLYVNLNVCPKIDLHKHLYIVTNDFVFMTNKKQPRFIYISCFLYNMYSFIFFISQSRGRTKKFKRIMFMLISRYIFMIQSCMHQRIYKLGYCKIKGNVIVLVCSVVQVNS